MASFSIQQDIGLISTTNNSLYGTEFIWEFGDGITSEDFEPQHEYEADGIYEVSLKVASMCGADSLSQDVWIILAPVAKFELEVDEACAGDEIMVTNLSEGILTTFEWISEGAEINDPSSESPSLIYNQSGIYDISLIVTNQSGTDTFTIENAISIISGVESSIDFLRNGLEVSFINGSTEGSHTWDFGDGIESNEREPIHNYSEENIYQVSHTIENICGTDESFLEVNLFSMPQAEFSLNLNSGCLPLEVYPENLSSDNSTSFTWISEGAEISGTETEPVLIYQLTGTYDITLIASNPAGKDTFSIENAIEVNDVPDAGFSFSKELMKVDFQSENEGGDQYIWQFGDGNSGTGKVVQHIYAEEGIYNVTLEVINTCGTVSSAKELEVNMLPSADFSVESSETCVGSTLTFSQEASPNTIEYEWQFPGGQPSSSTDPNPVISYPEAGIYDVIMIVKGIEGSDTIERQEFISVIQPPQIDVEVVIDGNNIILVNFTEGMTSSAFIIEYDTIHVVELLYEAPSNGIF